MVDFELSSNDVESILTSSRQLLKSIQSSFDHEELLLEHPLFLQSILLENNATSTRTNATLCSLLRRSKLFNFDNNTTIDTYFSTLQEPCERSKKISSLSAVVDWMPVAVNEEIRYHSNLATFKMDKISPTSDDWDVEINHEERVIKWRACNNPEKIILIPATTSTKPGKLQILTESSNPSPYYGLIFDNAEENMYSMNNDEYLSGGYGLLLTTTFLAGEYYDPYSHPATTTSSSSSTSPSSNERCQKLIDGEQFVVNDYHRKNDPESSYVNFRGISVTSPSGKTSGDGGETFFDLQLHGARGDRDDDASVVKIAANLVMGQFYTLQVFWRGRKNARTHSFYSLYSGSKTLESRVRFCNAHVRSRTVANEFCIGGLNESIEDVKKTKLFKGMITHLEILQTPNEEIPDTLARFIVKNQSIENVMEKFC